MTLHIITGSSAAARLDAVLNPSDDILLLENARIWNQHEDTSLDPVQHTEALQRPVLNGRPAKGRDFSTPKQLADVETVRRGDSVCIWSARNLDDVMLFPWLVNSLDAAGYSGSLSSVRAFSNALGDPISSVEQLSDAEIASFAAAQRPMNPTELALLRDRWAALKAANTQQFARMFAFDYSALKGWQDVLLAVLQRVPSVTWGHAPEAVTLLECLRIAKWDEGRAFVEYVTQLPFSPSKLREPDAKAAIAALRIEAEKASFHCDSVEQASRVLASANSSVSRCCVPFFWREALRAALPAGTGARIIN